MDELQSVEQHIPLPTGTNPESLSPFLPALKRLFNSAKRFLFNPAVILAVFLLSTLAAVLLKVSFDFQNNGIGYISNVNNFVVFRNSFYHLIEHSRIYGFMPGVQDDQFLYSPTFALLFAPFALLPKYVGVVVWSVFNSMILFYAIRRLPLDDGKKAFISWFILVELISTTQNVQSNPLVAALFILTFVAFESRRVALAALFVAISFYVKIFGVMGGLLFLVYPQRLKFAGWAAFWALLLFLLPLTVVSWKELSDYYVAWYGALQETHAHYTDQIFISVMRMVEGMRGAALSDAGRYVVQIAAFVLFSVKFLNRKAFNSTRYRMAVLSSVMVWCIIFNHASESNHYVIAALGVALWYVSGERHRLDLALLIGAFVLGASPSSLFPSYLRTQFVAPLGLMALPFFLIWLKTEFELTTSTTNNFLNSTDSRYAQD
ncbi:MAG TPA: glycosyltransferase family 87 protein [Bacteroidota bacterium]